MASMQELIWWNKFSDIMGKHWRLTPYLNSAIRNEYMRDYNDFLLKKGGRFLEVGCGTGWVGHYFAKNGMYVDGLDFSNEQLTNARKIAKQEGIENIEFFCRDLVNDPLEGRFDSYDSVLINAVLHHLSSKEIMLLLEKVSSLLSDGGRLYIYEPLIPRINNRFKYAMINIVDFHIRVFFFLLNKIIVMFDLLDDEFKKAIQDGYTGTSPDEKPIDYDLVRKSCNDNDLNLIEIIPFHNYSIAFSMGIMKLADSYREDLSKFAMWFYKIDKFLFKNFDWNNSISRNSRSVLCGMKFQKAFQ